MIEISGLNKSFRKVTAVQDLSLKVERGQIFGLVGPDGAGKTTLMRMICGLIVPDTGKIRLFAGQSPGDAVSDQFGYMPQRFSLYGDLTVQENIDFFGRLFGLNRKTIEQRAQEILEITRLREFAHRLADDLSGGMRQKLALTCALITRPPLLILDEPTYGVDPQIRKEFWRILYRLNRDGVTVLVSTPYMDEAELCHRVAIMDQGRVVAVDSPAALRKMIPYRMLEVRCDTRDPSTFEDVKEVLESSFFGDRFHLAVDDVALAKPLIRDVLLGSGVKLVSIHEIQPAMEDVFIALTRKAGHP